MQSCCFKLPYFIQGCVEPVRENIRENGIIKEHKKSPYHCHHRLFSMAS
jgi:hypothetical protein